MLDLTPEETEQLRRPEIPLARWRKGEALFASKFERLAILQAGPEIISNPLRKQIIAEKAKLRTLVANDPKLVEDFQFFTRKLAWEPEALLQGLLADCNMMKATAQSVIAKEKRNHWPIEQLVLHDACQDLSELASLVERINQTAFSPARTVALRSETGERFSGARERYLLTAFQRLPEILCSYGGELRRKIENTSHFWFREKKFWNTAVDTAREDSVFERIHRQLGRYHSVRLYRLTNAGRQAKGLSSIEYRAFLVWLNRLRKRCQRTQRLRDFVLEHRDKQIVLRQKSRSGRTTTSYVAATAEISAIVRLIRQADHVCVQGQWHTKKEFEKQFLDVSATSS